jgi:hypothetical protein
LYLGELASNRSTGKLYLGCDSGIVEVGGSGGTAVSQFTGDGSATAFHPIGGYSDTTVGNYLVSVAGIDQRPTTDWTIGSANSGTITFASAPPDGAAIVVRAFTGSTGGGGGSGDATSLQGRALADTAPTNGQAIVWDNASSTWKPGTVSGGGGTDIGGRAWSSTATYTSGDVVATDQNSMWICIRDDNTNHDPTSAFEWWAPMPATAVSIWSRTIAATAPANLQALVWNSTTSNWEPQDQQGPQGPQGAQGAQGPQGEQGPQGTPGTNGTNGQGFNWRGSYEPTTLYLSYDVVYVEGFGAYIKVQPSEPPTGIYPPSSPLVWNRFA